MDNYIGTKIIQAEPMDLARFSIEVKPVPGVVEVDSEGKGKPGYKVIYADGYVSWSPKDVFEYAYRKISIDEEIMILTNNQ